MSPRRGVFFFPGYVGLGLTTVGSGFVCVFSWILDAFVVYTIIYMITVL